MSKGRKLAAELHREVVNRAYAKRMTAEVAPSHSAAPDYDPICVNCGELESNHAMIGDWCRSESEDKIWSTTRKFARASAAPPSEREATDEQLQKILGDVMTEAGITWYPGRLLPQVCEAMRRMARAALPQAARPAELRGTWPENCVQRAFVEGAKWWEFRQSGGTMWPSDRDIVEVAAIEKYGHPGAAAVPAPATEWENRYRQLLWESHAGYTHRSYLYGDDGEMQCNHHDCLLDFKRAAIEEIDKHLWEMNLKRAAKQQAVAAVPAPERDERDKLYACYIHDEGELKLVGVALCEVDADGWKGAMEQDASENRIVKETGRIRRGAGATAPPKEGK